MTTKSKNLAHLDRAFEKSRKKSKQASGKKSRGGSSESSRNVTIKLPAYVANLGLTLTSIEEKDRVSTGQIVKILGSSNKVVKKLMSEGKIVTKFAIDPGQRGTYFSLTEVEQYAKTADPSEYLVRKDRPETTKPDAVSFHDKYAHLKQPARIQQLIGWEMDRYKAFQRLVRLSGMTVYDYFTKMMDREEKQLREKMNVAVKQKKVKTAAKSAKLEAQAEAQAQAAAGRSAASRTYSK